MHSTRLPMVGTLLIATVVAGSALAQDDIDLGLDEIMNDIDLGGEGGAELLTYNGSADSTAPKYVPGKPVTITHYAGSIRVNCAEREGIAARIAYSITGPNTTALETMGKGMGVATSGSATAGSVKTRVPAKPSSVTSYKMDLIVNLPKDAGVNIVGGNGAVQVVGCNGWVKSTNKAGGTYIQGKLTAVDVNSASGDVKVDIAENSEMTGVSNIKALGGNVSLGLPISYTGKIYAKGSSVSATRHTVNGTNSDTFVQGEIGAGGKASLNISASGSVEITTP